MTDDLIHWHPGQPAHRHPGGSGMHWHTEHQRNRLPLPDEDEHAVVSHLHPLKGWHEHVGGDRPHSYEEGVQ